MAGMLRVYHYDAFVGELDQDRHGQMSFVYDSDWLSRKDAIPLSQSLPLRHERFTRQECRPFFAGVLPDDVRRKVIAGIFGISAQNDFAMLAEIGGECAGAVTLLPPGVPLSKSLNEYREVAESKLGEVLRNLPRRPLMAGEEGIRISLAGAQDKLAVRIVDTTFSIPLGNSPSTHIIKPAIGDFEDIVRNEAFCLRLADVVGIPSAHVDIKTIDGVECLVVERYDRKLNGNAITRVHQEDFCQALGFAPEMKYQSEGGPSLKHCFELVRRVSSLPVIDLQHLLDAVIFNLVIGNNDAHARNFSLLRFKDSAVRLAPLYDLLCTVYYSELAATMAMKIGGKDDPLKVGPSNFKKLAQEAGLAPPMVKSRVLDMTDRIRSGLREIPKEDATSQAIGRIIMERSEKFGRRFSR